MTRDDMLDAALARALSPPALPVDFRARLSAAIAREAELQAANRAARPRLENEQRQRLAELEAGYLRLRRRTLGTVIGGAFAAGAAVAVAMPWLKATFGANAMLVLSVVGAAVGLAIGTASWMARLGVPTSLQKF
jgi:hypothetical protein